jgi:hypothetical protein
MLLARALLVQMVKGAQTVVVQLGRRVSADVSATPALQVPTVKLHRVVLLLPMGSNASTAGR